MDQWGEADRYASQQEDEGEDLTRADCVAEGAGDEADEEGRGEGDDVRVGDLGFG